MGTVSGNAGTGVAIGATRGFPVSGTNPGHVYGGRRQRRHDIAYQQCTNVNHFNGNIVPG